MKYLKFITGVLLLSLPFIGMVYLMVLVSGLVVTLQILGASLLVFATLFYGLHLIFWLIE